MTTNQTIAVVIGLALVAALGVVVSAAERTVTFRVEGMTCGGCATQIAKALRATPGVSEARVSFEKSEAWLRYDDRTLDVAKLRKVVVDAGYGAPEGDGVAAAAANPSCKPGEALSKPHCAAADSDGATAAAGLPYSTDLAELRTRFNHDKGKVRVVMLLSPTCPMCLHGASEIETKVLEAVKNPGIRIYAVSVPILDSDAEPTVARATARVPDTRVSRYWDARGELVKAYARTLSLGERPAWDVYLLYGPEVEWTAEPPAPRSWMHQLQGLDPARRLDGERFAAEVTALVASGDTGGT